jgi:hypothetical protein
VNDCIDTNYCYCTADREEGRLKNDLVRLNQEKDELKERKSAYEVRQYATSAPKD